MANERVTEQSQEKAQKPGLKTIAVMQVSEAYFLVREDDQASIVFEYVDPSRNSLYYLKETRRLPQESFVRFENVPVNKLTIVQVGVIPPSIHWHEKTTGVDELLIILHGSDAIKNELIDIEIHEQELMDLFFLNPSVTPTTTFFTIDTTTHELICIALNRQFPVLLTLTPGKDGMNLSSKMGLLTLLDNIYAKLSERLTPLQWTVNERLYDEMAPDGIIKFQYDESTVAKKRQKDIQKRIYQIQALLIALKAEAGRGENDPRLLTHVPYLHDKPQRSGNKFLEKVLGEPTSTKSVITIDNTIWEKLLSEPSSKLFSESQKQTALPVAPQSPQVMNPIQVQSETAKIVTPQIQSPQHSQLPHLTNPPVSVQETHQRTLTEKQKAIMLAHELDVELFEAISLFRDTPLYTIGLKEANILNTHLDRLTGLIQGYVSKRRRGKPPENPTKVSIIVRTGSINVTGIKDNDVYEYLTSNKEQNYKAKVEAVFAAWESYIRPIYILSNSRSERKLSSLKVSGTVRTHFPQIATTLISNLYKIVDKDEQTSTQKDINVVEVSYILLVIQALHALREQYLGLKRDGQAVEIDNWASYCYATLPRLRNLMKLPT